MGTTRIKTPAVPECIWEEVWIEEDELITGTRYFDGNTFVYLTASGGTLEELEKCIIELTTWPSSPIKRNIYWYKGQTRTILGQDHERALAYL